jgi:hypothetical protein
LRQVKRSTHSKLGLCEEASYFPPNISRNSSKKCIKLAPPTTVKGVPLPTHP